MTPATTPAEQHNAVAAKWDAMIAEAKTQGTPVIVRFYDGKHKVVAFGVPKGKQVFIHSGEFNPDGSGGGEILCAFDAETLAKLLPTIMHALNVANGLVVEEPEEAPELEPRDE